MPMEGSAPRVVWGLLQRGPRAFPEMEAHGPLREADEEDGRVLRQRAQQGGLEMAGDGFQEFSRSSGGEKTGKNPTDRGKRGAKINLLVDERGAPVSVVLTGANRHDKVSAIDLIVSVSLKRPSQKEQHLCADKAYDATDVREFAISGGYTTHIKVNPRKQGAEPLPNHDSSRKVYPARRWMVERTISWLTKRRSLRTRWSKKAGNWLAFDSLSLRPYIAQLGGFRIESKSGAPHPPLRNG